MRTIIKVFALALSLHLQFCGIFVNDDGIELPVKKMIAFSDNKDTGDEFIPDPNSLFNLVCDSIFANNGCILMITEFGGCVSNMRLDFKSFAFDKIKFIINIMHYKSNKPNPYLLLYNAVAKEKKATLYNIDLFDELEFYLLQSGILQQNLSDYSNDEDISHQGISETGDLVDTFFICDPSNSCNQVVYGSDLQCLALENPCEDNQVFDDGLNPSNQTREQLSDNPCICDFVINPGDIRYWYII